MVFNFREKPWKLSFRDVQVKNQLLRGKSMILIIFCDFWNASNSFFFFFFLFFEEATVKLKQYISKLTVKQSLKRTCPALRPFKNLIF